MNYEIIFHIKFENNTIFNGFKMSKIFKKAI